MAAVNTVRGHAFISYVREDKVGADRVQRILEAANVPVWRDTGDLWPGEDWKLKIREAITRDALAFVACFSDQSTARQTSYQNEELLLAIDQLRRRPPEQPWLIPVRFSDCQLPQFDLGAGRTLDSLQRVDLFGTNLEESAARLAAGVLRILGVSDVGNARPVHSASVASFLKAALLDPVRQIEVEDAVMTLASEAVAVLVDAGEFPTSSDRLTNDNAGVRFLLERAGNYWDAVIPLTNALIVGCAWGQRNHDLIWQHAIERVAGTANESGGQTALLEMRRYPILPLLYGGGLAALHHRNLPALRALAVDARFRSDSGPTIPLIGASNVWRPFSQADITSQLLALDASGEPITDDLISALRSRTRGQRHTPVSDQLHDGLRDNLRSLIPDDEDYTDTFDRLEALLALIAVDAKIEADKRSVYLDGAWYGAFTWRHRYMRDTLEERLLAEFESEGQGWPPINAGLFGGSVPRATAAFEIFISDARAARQRQF